MEVDSEQLLKLTKDLAEGVLKLRIKISEQEGRIARLEHVIANQDVHVDAIARSELPRPSQSIIYAQRDIIGE